VDDLPYIPDAKNTRDPVIKIMKSLFLYKNPLRRTLMVCQPWYKPSWFIQSPKGLATANN